MFESIPDWVVRHASRKPEAVALRDRHGAMTWRQLNGQVHATARMLIEAGAQAGEVAAVLGGNSAHWVAALLGAMRAGLTVAPFSTWLKSDALAALLRDCRPHTVFCDGDSRGLAESGIASSGGATRVVGLNPSEPCAVPRSLARNPPRPALPTRIVPELPAHLIYSSGTTGVPKGILHSHAVRSASMRAFGEKVLRPGCTSVLSTPLSSNWTLTGLLGTLGTGGTSILIDRFKEDAFLDLCEAEQPDFLFLVPTQIERLLDHPGFGRRKLSGKTVKLSTGSPLTPERKRQAASQWPGPLVEIYGLTEGGITTMLVVGDDPRKLSSVGRPGPDITVRIIDESGHERPIGHVGEVVGRSPYRMLGYLGRPDLDAALAWRAPDGTMYQRTGDLGRLDEDGYLYIVGRAKDMLVCGGQNVYPSDIESVLLTHPGVAESAVIGISSARWGEQPFAVVVPRPGAVVDAHALAAWANERLARHQRLAGIDFVTRLPRGTLGKVLKSELRQSFGRGLHRNVVAHR